MFSNESRYARTTMTADTVADLMRLADEFADRMATYEESKFECDFGDIIDERRRKVPYARAALESAIRAALADARKQAIQDATQVVNEWYAPVGIAEALSMKRSITSAIRALIDKKEPT